MSQHHRRPVVAVLIGFGALLLAGCGSVATDGPTTDHPALSPAAASGLIWSDEVAVPVAPLVPAPGTAQTIVVTIGSPTA